MTESSHDITKDPEAMEFCRQLADRGITPEQVEREMRRLQAEEDALDAVMMGLELHPDAPWWIRDEVEKNFGLVCAMVSTDPRDAPDDIEEAA